MTKNGTTTGAKTRYSDEGLIPNGRLTASIIQIDV
jgi:hypothetical protein